MNELLLHQTIDHQCRIAIVELEEMLEEWKRRHEHLIQPLRYGPPDLPQLASTALAGQHFNNIDSFSKLLELNVLAEDCDNDF
jgi:hypothetical protein